MYVQICTCLYTYFKIFLLQFLLELYEFLTQVEGYGVTLLKSKWGCSSSTISSNVFTNLKKVHRPYGGGKELNFTHFQSSVGKIVGFLGKISSVVDSPGVFMSHDL